MKSSLDLSRDVLLVDAPGVEPGSDSAKLQFHTAINDASLRRLAFSERLSVTVTLTAEGRIEMRVPTAVCPTGNLFDAGFSPSGVSQAVLCSTGSRLSHPAITASAVPPASFSHLFAPEADR